LILQPIKIKNKITMSVSLAANCSNKGKEVDTRNNRDKRTLKLHF